MKIHFRHWSLYKMKQLSITSIVPLMRQSVELFSCMNSRDERYEAEKFDSCWSISWFVYEFAKVTAVVDWMNVSSSENIQRIDMCESTFNKVNGYLHNFPWYRGELWRTTVLLLMLSTRRVHVLLIRHVSPTFLSTDSYFQYAWHLKFSEVSRAHSLTIKSLVFQ